MKIDYKFEPSQKVFYTRMESVPYERNCSMCGEGVLLTKAGKEVTCPKCKGSKKISDSGSIKEIVKEGKIKNIKIFIDHNETDIEYCVHELSNGFVERLNESQIYKTYEEADKSINKNTIMGHTS
jgi:ribosomal protein S27AE